MSSLIIFTMLAFTSSVAIGSDATADYVVPTGPELVAYSRFKVGIVQSYTGAGSKEISYLFPAELTGEPGLLVKFNLIEEDESRGLSRWDSPTMNAICTDDGKKVQCNIYVKKEPMSRKVNFSQVLRQQMATFSGQRLSLKGKPLLDSTKAIDFLNNSGLPKDVIADKLKVLDQFLNSEPGGILSYEYK